MTERAVIPRRSIGGELELESIPAGRGQMARLAGVVSGTWTASGRGALAVILGELARQGVQSIELPAFICDSVVSAATASSLEVTFYPVDQRLRSHPLGRGATLIVDYFGWITPVPHGLSTSCVLDTSHSFLSEGRRAPEAAYRMFSVRKLGPVPLAGWCSVEVDLPEPPVELEWQSMAARALRGSYLARPDDEVSTETEDLYLSALADVERRLDEGDGRWAIPAVSKQIVDALDWDAVAAARRRNWTHLHEMLGDRLEPVTGELDSGIVPLGYVIRIEERDRVRKELAKQRIFCPVHWPLPEQVDRAAFPDAAVLSDELLTLPIDQRYGSSEMERLAAAVRSALG